MTDMTVSNTILAQLGGRRFIVMTGAKDFVGGEKTLAMKLPSNMVKGRASHCRITLDPSDTYTVETLKISRKLGHTTQVNVVEAANDVYSDQLQSTFKRLTGLDTHL